MLMSKTLWLEPRKVRFNKDNMNTVSITKRSSIIAIP